ncbi:MAG: hypothetical protein RI558_05780 [Psychroflexus sp.]|nr:hypothetical protein [Psychroflexus sp.]
MIHRAFLMVLFICLFISFSKAQESNLWLEPEIGLSFVQDDLARIYGDIEPRQELSNSLILSLRPKLYYQLEEKLWIGAHLGYAYEFASLDDQRDINISNYKIGLQVRYDILEMFNHFQIYSEIGGNYNYLSSNQAVDEDYFKFYTDIGARFYFSKKLYAGLIFKDLISYHSNAINFRNRDGFHIANPVKELLEFPFFMIGFNFN